MAREADLRVRASELTRAAEGVPDEERQALLLRMATRYVLLAENESWLVNNSMSIEPRNRNR